mmetsp:Transcript_16937/g.43185  ORF Transcript_16937/g.43185 Transcript_16937/m.43185 type:complete len:329 (+) Transcript_16937:109-1095(+)
MEEEEIKEAIKGKTGPELFRELMRQLPLVVLDDYYKHGIWQNDLMRLDIQILNAHRLEAGAPDVPPLSEIKIPEIPDPPKPLTSVTAPQLLGGLIRPVAVTAAGALRPVSALTAPALNLPATSLRAPGAAATGPAAAVQTVAPPGIVVPPGVVAPPRPAASAPVTNGSTAAADLRAIALFISKWRLDPARTSALLMKLAPLRRNFVMQNFKDATLVNGAAVPIAKLEEYIAQCEKSGAWAVLEGAAGAKAPAVVTLGAAVPAVSAAAVVAPPAKAVAGSTTVAPMLAGLKRTFDQTLSWQAALPKNAGAAIQQQPGPPVAKMRPTFAR